MDSSTGPWNTRKRKDMPDRPVMDIHECAEYLGISADTLYKYAAEGFIPAFRLGNRWRFYKKRIDEWMDEKSDANVEAKDERTN